MLARFAFSNHRFVRRPNAFHKAPSLGLYSAGSAPYIYKRAAGNVRFFVIKETFSEKRTSLSNSASIASSRMAKLQEVFPQYLRTRRLTLELFNHSPEHYETILGVMNSPTAHQIMGDYGVRTPAQLDEVWHRTRLRSDRFINGIADAPCYYNLRLGADGDDGELIGTLSFCQRTVEGASGTKVLPPDLGWGLLEPYMGKGYATEAARELMRFLIDQLGYRSMLAFPDNQNARSNRVAEKLGFVDAGAIPNLDEPGKMVGLLVLPGTGELGLEDGISFKHKDEAIK